MISRSDEALTETNTEQYAIKMIHIDIAVSTKPYNILIELICIAVALYILQITQRATLRNENGTLFNHAFFFF